MSSSARQELLSSHGTNFDELPSWQKRGVGVRWETHEKEGANPKTGETVLAERRRLAVDDELPMRGAYLDYVRARVEEARR